MFSPLPGLGATGLSLIAIFSCRVFSQRFFGETQYGWNRDCGWLLSTCQCLAFPLSLLTMDSPPWDTTLSIYSSSLCNKSQNRSSQAFSSSPLCPRSLNRFCWWASQTIDEWTRPCVSGVAVGISPQQGRVWQHVFTSWFHLLSPRKCIGICQ